MAISVGAHFRSFVSQSRDQPTNKIRILGSVSTASLQRLNAARMTAMHARFMGRAGMKETRSRGARAHRQSLGRLRPIASARSAKRGNEGTRKLGPMRETDIASARTGVTHGSPSAGNKNAVRREKGDTMETQWARVDDGATWTRAAREKRERQRKSDKVAKGRKRGSKGGGGGERGIASLQRYYNWRRWCTSRRGAISFALSRMSEQKAHDGPLSLSPPPPFPARAARSSSFFSPFLSVSER